MTPPSSIIRSFFLPKFTKKYLLRLSLEALAVFIFFGYICRPCLIQGESMLPTYPSRGLLFCWKPAFWFSKPKRGQVVMAKFVGNNVMLLKRIVALEGDTVQFKNGKLIVNDSIQNEEWILDGTCNWELPPRTVEKGCVYIVGDNRSMDITAHVFGQIHTDRLVGIPLW